MAFKNSWNKKGRGFSYSISFLSPEPRCRTWIRPRPWRPRPTTRRSLRSWATSRQCCCPFRWTPGWFVAEWRPCTAFRPSCNRPAKLKSREKCPLLNDRGKFPITEMQGSRPFSHILFDLCTGLALHFSMIISLLRRENCIFLFEDDACAIPFPLPVSPIHRHFEFYHSLERTFGPTLLRIFFVKNYLPLGTSSKCLLRSLPRKLEAAKTNSYPIKSQVCEEAEDVGHPVLIVEVLCQLERDVEQWLSLVRITLLKRINIMKESDILARRHSS